MFLFCSSPNKSIAQIYSGKKSKDKCYAKCLISDTSKDLVAEYPIYNGDDFTSEFIEEIEIEIIPAHTEWAKRLADKNCYSSNPNDCMVWCLVEVPAETIELVIVTDTHQMKEFVLESVTIAEIEDEGILEKKEVICEDDITPKFMKLLKESLVNWGYETGLTDRYKIGDKTKKSLIQFQRDNELPIGQLDLETLDLLGVEY